jgi:hypothetical protein
VVFLSYSVLWSSMQLWVAGLRKVLEQENHSTVATFEDGSCVSSSDKQSEEIIIVVDLDTFRRIRKATWSFIPL